MTRKTHIFKLIIRKVLLIIIIILCVLSTQYPLLKLTAHATDPHGGLCRHLLVQWRSSRVAQMFD